MLNPRQSLVSVGAISACVVAAALAGCVAEEGDGGAGGNSGTTGSPAGGAGSGGKAVAGSSGAGVAGGPVGSGGAGGSSAGAGTSGGAGTGGASPVAGKGGAGGSNDAGRGGAVAGTGGTGAGGSGAGSGAGGGSAGGGAGTEGGSAGSGGAGGGSSGGGAGGGGGEGGKANTCPPAEPLTGGTQYCSNTTGNVGSYHYELWAEGMGTGCMKVYNRQAIFSANWNNVEDLLARVGLLFDRSKTHKQIGNITAEFAETKTGNDGLVYVGIYGWTVNPLKEYYILDDWGDTKPAGTASDGTPRDRVGTITVDGDTYDVWKKLRVDKPAITGPSETFEQYFSIRTTARQCGTISISEHFTKWEELGLELGALTEAKLLVEAQDSSGTIEFTTATVVVD